ncbi:TPA: Protease Do-like 5, chloroplastic [Trebouxia sp. C0006]
MTSLHAAVGNSLTLSTRPPNRMTACGTHRYNSEQQRPSICHEHSLQAMSADFATNSHLCRRQALLGLLGGLTLSLQPLPALAGLIDEKQADKVFESANQSVVSIADYKVANGNEVSEGTGSGFMWDTYGHVVTNYHCVAKFATDRIGAQVTRVGIVDANGDTIEYPASLVGTDAQHDIAVLLVDAPLQSFVPVQVGTSADLRTGQSVYAIGNPLGFSKTLTAGVVSGLNRAIPSPVGTKTYGAIQTDAAISAGNSGGPLLDSSARVIGINTATFTRTGTGRSSGVNFALPIDLVMTVVPNLIVYGTASGKGVKGGS